MNIDYNMLAGQKGVLLRVIEQLAKDPKTKDQANELDGIVNLIDAIEDKKEEVIVTLTPKLAKEHLASKGYEVSSLWSIADVDRVIEEENVNIDLTSAEKLDLLTECVNMNRGSITVQINNSIFDALEDKQ